MIINNPYFLRNINIETAIEKIKNGEPYVIRFKSMGDPDKRFVFESGYMYKKWEKEI